MTWLARVLLVIAALALPARANPTIVPVDCVQFWPADSWDELLSLAACAQDTTVGHIYFEDQVDGLLEELDTAMITSLQIYFAAVRNGPKPIKLRAAYQMAVMQVSMMTRARNSIAPTAPANAGRVRAVLEAQLEPTARVAWKLFATIDEAATDRPSLASDAVTLHMVRMSRVYADALDASWHFSDDRPSLLTDAERRPPCPDCTSSIPNSK